LQETTMGDLKVDDAGRPKIKLRKHDLVVGGFAICTHRHGEKAPEFHHVRQSVKLITDLNAGNGQKLFDWPMDSDGPIRNVG
jgi:hypothetical protein